MRPILLISAAAALVGAPEIAAAGDVLLVVQGTVESISGPISTRPELAALQPGDSVTATYCIEVPGTPRPTGGLDYTVNTSLGALATPTGSIGGEAGPTGALFLEDAPGVDILSTRQDLTSEIELIVATLDFSSVLLPSEDVAALAGTSMPLPASITTRIFGILNGDTTIQVDPQVISFESADGIGTSYCVAAANSTGVAATIRAIGSETASANDLTLQASDLPTNVFGFFLVSRDRGFVPMPGGSAGNLCLSGTIGRFVGPGMIQNSGANGQFELGVDLTMIPQAGSITSAVAGDTFAFQAWCRDNVGGSATSNFTNGVEIVFE